MYNRHKIITKFRFSSCVVCNKSSLSSVALVPSRNHSHMARINLLNSSLDSDSNSPSKSYTYPKNSSIINERHFYQNTVLMDWVNKAPRPVSLRQLAFFGRKLTPEKIISSANFVRVELPVRLAHRVRDLQQLPFAVVSNTHISQVYEQYYKAFDKFRKFPLITNLEENDEFCSLLTELLDEHLSIIPKLVMGAIECSIADCIESERLDKFMSSMLCSRISRRVIAEQHLSLSKTFRADQGQNELPHDPNFIGAVFLQCSARDSVSQCAKHATALIQELYPGVEMPKVEIEVQQQLKNDDITFPYIKSHLDYIIGELLRNSIEATVLFWQKNHARDPQGHPHPSPITVSISNTPQNVFVRISDKGGGVPHDILPHIWSFAKGPRSLGHLHNFKQVPTLAGLSGEVRTHLERSRPPPALEVSDTFLRTGAESINDEDTTGIKSSLASLTSRSSHLKLGMGLPLSRVYAEYWDGALDLHSLEGYGCDVFLKISRLGNQMERLQLDKV